MFLMCRLEIKLFISMEDHSVYAKACTLTSANYLHLVRASPVKKFTLNSHGDRRLKTQVKKIKESPTFPSRNKYRYPPSISFSLIIDHMENCSAIKLTSSTRIMA